MWRPTYAEMEEKVLFIAVGTLRTENTQKVHLSNEIKRDRFHSDFICITWMNPSTKKDWFHIAKLLVANKYRERPYSHESSRMAEMMPLEHPRWGVIPAWRTLTLVCITNFGESSHFFCVDPWRNSDKHETTKVPTFSVTVKTRVHFSSITVNAPCLILNANANRYGYQWGREMFLTGVL